MVEVEVEGRERERQKRLDSAWSTKHRPHTSLSASMLYLVCLAANGRLQLSVDEVGQAVEDGELCAIGGAERGQQRHQGLCCGRQL
jgi:hypothetical protein